MRTHSSSSNLHHLQSHEQLSACMAHLRVREEAECDTRDLHRGHLLGYLSTHAAASNFSIYPTINRASRQNLAHANVFMGQAVAASCMHVECMWTSIRKHDAAGVYSEVARSQKCISQIRKTLQTTVTGPLFVAMPRVAARQLLALAAAARMPAASYAQPAASLWSSAVSPTSCSQSCTCSRCATSGRHHGVSCGCSSCRTRSAVLGMPTAPSGRMHLATLGDSQDKVGCTLLSRSMGACTHPATLT